MHSHYDNLKVARNAPVEVVRAAYKALSQRYHPDKNPDQKHAAHVMALLNNAYEVLSDPGKRQEHDDWIATAEAELQAQERLRRRVGQHHAPPLVLPVRRDGSWSRLVHDRPWWCAPALCLGIGIGLGWLGSALLPAHTAVLASLARQPAIVPRPAALAGTNADSVIAVISRVQIAAVGDPCAAAPGNAPWPQHSTYLDGYPIASGGGNTRVIVDNAGNDAAILVQLFDLAGQRSVRHAFVLPRQQFTMDNLASGNYELRYQNLYSASMPRPDCASAPAASSAASPPRVVAGK
ncbi:J domain-containing protein [Undibacterium arcticum]